MSQTIRLCTWNIQLGLQRDTIVEALRTVPDFIGLDLLALQEASIHSDQEDACALAAALGPSYASFQATAHFLGSMPQANALVWNKERVRVSRQETVILPSARHARLSRAERAFLCALPQQQRISIVADGTLGSEVLRLYVAHLDVLGYAFKREQFDYILQDARTRKPAASLVMIMGDLNTFHIRSYPSWSALTGAARADGFEDLTSEVAYTHHAFRRVRFRQKLDAVFVRSEHPLHYRSWSRDIPGSDHIPVFAEITVN